MKPLPNPEVLMHKVIASPHVFISGAFTIAFGFFAFGVWFLLKNRGTGVGITAVGMARSPFLYADHSRFVHDPVGKIVADRWEIALKFAGLQWTRDMANRHFYFTGNTGSGKTACMNGLFDTLF